MGSETPEGIQALFRQSRLFRGASLTNLQQGQEGDLWVDVGFGDGPFLFRVAGPTPSAVYQTLYRLVQELIEAERDRRRDGQPERWDGAGHPPAGRGNRLYAPRA